MCNSLLFEDTKAVPHHLALEKNGGVPRGSLGNKQCAQS